MVRVYNFAACHFGIPCVCVCVKSKIFTLDAAPVHLFPNHPQPPLSKKPDSTRHGASFRGRNSGTHTHMPTGREKKKERRRRNKTKSPKPNRNLSPDCKCAFPSGHRWRLGESPFVFLFFPFIVFLI